MPARRASVFKKAIFARGHKRVQKPLSYNFVQYFLVIRGFLQPFVANAAAAEKTCEAR